MDRIKIEGMEFRGRHGCKAAERELGQPFIVDVSMYFDVSPAGKSDDINKTVNYAKVFEAVETIVEGEPVALIEALAEHISEALFERFALIQKLRVVVHKPSAPIPGKFADVSVSITRERGKK